LKVSNEERIVLRFKISLPLLIYLALCKYLNVQNQSLRETGDEWLWKVALRGPELEKLLAFLQSSQATLGQLAMKDVY
jgi:hypothetical protein